MKGAKKTALCHARYERDKDRSSLDSVKMCGTLEEKERKRKREKERAETKRPRRPSQARAKKQTAPATVGTPKRRGSSQAEAAEAKRPCGPSFFSKYVVKKDANDKDDE